MRIGSRLLAPILLVLLVCGMTAAARAEVLKPIYDGSRVPEYLFVISAKSISYADGVLTLHDAPGAVYFADRPYRLYGHLSLDDFVDFAEESLASDPPNAALSLLDSEDVVVVELLGDPDERDGKLTWRVKVLSGDMPGEGGAASLFVDPMCQPQITD